MSAAAHELYLTAGETVSGLWLIDDGAEPTPAPMTPDIATCVVARLGSSTVVDWSEFLTIPGDPPEAGQLALEVPGTATAALGADQGPGPYQVQLWAAFDVDTVPDVLLASIDMRLNVGIPSLAAVEITGVVLAGA